MAARQRLRPGRWLTLASKLALKAATALRVLAKEKLTRRLTHVVLQH